MRRPEKNVGTGADVRHMKGRFNPRN